MVIFLNIYLYIFIVIIIFYRQKNTIQKWGLFILLNASWCGWELKFQIVRF